MGGGINQITASRQGRTTTGDTRTHNTPTAAKAVETAELWKSSSNSIIIEEQTQDGGVPAIHWGQYTCGAGRRS